MSTHSSTLAWTIPWTEGPGGLQSMGSLGVGHDWATSLSLFTFLHWRRKCSPLQCSCLENPMDGGACWAAVCGVSQSRTQLKRLSSSSSSSRVIVYSLLVKKLAEFKLYLHFHSCTFFFLYFSKLLSNSPWSSLLWLFQINHLCPIYIFLITNNFIFIRFLKPFLYHTLSLLA